MLHLDSATKLLTTTDSSAHNAMNWNVETMIYGYLGGNFDSTFQERFDRLSLALSNEKFCWDFVLEENIADIYVQNFIDSIIPTNSSLEFFAKFWNRAYEFPV